MNDRIEELLSMLVASEVQNIANAIARSEAKKKGAEDQLPRPTQEQYKEAVQRLQSLAATVRKTLSATE